MDVICALVKYNYFVFITGSRGVREVLVDKHVVYQQSGAME